MKESDSLKQAMESLGPEFELVRELGRGATAVVYLLRDHALDRDVAMKVIRPSFGANDEAIARLQREARLVAKLQHPNIVKLYESRRLPDGSLALLMEHIPGRNLKEVVNDDGALPVNRAVGVLKDVASALAYAHRRHIVHRDVKPENVYIDEEVGTARLADFGVARPWDRDSRLTLPGESLGTPAYMSPEQIDGLDVDGRSDVYSLGLVGYEILMGHHPWEGENLFTVIFKQKNEDLPSLATQGLGVSQGLAGALEKAVRKDPDGRWESAEAFLNRLVALEEDKAEATGETADWVTPASTEEGRDVVLPVAPEDELPWSRPTDPPVAVKKKRRWVLPLAVLAVAAPVGGFTAYNWLWTGGGMTDSQGGMSNAEAAELPVSDGPERVPEVPMGPLSFEVPEGTSLSGAIGSTLVLAVRLADGYGVPVIDTLVQFRVADGEGVLASGAGVRTDTAGIAQATLQLSERPGPVTVVAALEGSYDVPEFRFEVRARPGAPSRAIVLAGDGQSGLVGTALPQSVGVRVSDQGGNPVPGVEVRFQIMAGGGRVGPALTQTDSVGRAFARWTLGGAAGPQSLAAFVPSAENTLLTFAATARAPAPVQQPDEE
ncbi:protein kinase, partial [Gemmatimonadota bacterium]